MVKLSNLHREGEYDKEIGENRGKLSQTSELSDSPYWHCIRPPITRTFYI